VEAASTLRHASILGAVLAPLWDEGVALLHDRHIPGGGATIDQLAVCAGGVFVIGAASDVGRVERRFSGGWLSRAEHLYVGGSERTSLVGAMAEQHRAVASALAGEFAHVPVVQALCLPSAEWAVFAQPLRVRDVHVVSTRALVQLLRGGGPLSANEVAAIEGQLAVAFPPA
jgi:hypothetical protein